MTRIFTYLIGFRLLIVEVTPVDSLSYSVTLTDVSLRPSNVTPFKNYGEVAQKFEREYTRGDGDTVRIAKDMVEFCTSIEVS